MVAVAIAIWLSLFLMVHDSTTRSDMPYDLLYATHASGLIPPVMMDAAVLLLTPRARSYATQGFDRLFPSRI